jgi:hypothetical protein
MLEAWKRSVVYHEPPSHQHVVSPSLFLSLHEYSVHCFLLSHFAVAGV